MRVIVIGVVLATSMGCATVGKVGANTTNYRGWGRGEDEASATT